MALTWPVPELSTVDVRSQDDAAPRRAALTGTAPRGGSTLLAGTPGPRRPGVPARLVSPLQGIPTQQQISDLVSTLQHPEAFLRIPPQLHAVAMQCPVQRPTFPHEGERPILPHCTLQMQTKDRRHILLVRLRAQSPLLGCDGFLPAACRELARLQMDPLIIIVSDHLRQEAIPFGKLSPPILLAQEGQAAREIIEALFN